MKKTKNLKKNKIKKEKKLNIKNIKLRLKDLLLESKEIFISNKLFLIYILGSVINGILLRAITIGKVFSISPFLADLFVSIIFASFYFIINEKRRNLYLIIISIISTIVCIGNAIYYFYYSSYISITFISFALTNHETGGANVVGNLLQFKCFIFLWFPITLLILKGKLKPKNSSGKEVLKSVYALGLICLIVFLCTLKPVDYGRFYSQWNREYLVSKFGVYLYQLNDIVKSVEPKMATLFGSDKANREISTFYEENKQETKKNKYTNALKGKNIIAIHAESMQSVLIGLKINGVEITPNLNKLTKQGVYFNNFYSQVSFGTSSDTEFTLATSLMPVSNGTVFINYYDRQYISMYNLLKEKGYYTFSMHANTGDFWNRNIMHKNLGYNDFYDKATYEIDEEIGFGLSDRSFVMQSVAKIEEIAKKHKNYYGTMITLSNHTPFDYNELFEKLDMTKHVDGKEYQYMQDTKLGNYFVSAHYADKQLGLLMEELQKRGLLENTAIMIYGDHDARISTSLWNRFYNYDYMTNELLSKEDENYKELDYYWQEMNRRVPLIIWSNDKTFQEKYRATIDKVMGMYDVAPTLGNMMGFKNEYALGHDIFSVKNNIVVFPNGNFVTDYVYYNDNKDEYKLLKDIPLDADYITNNKKYTDKILDISNDIIVYNYFKKELSDQKYEEEE